MCQKLYTLPDTWENLSESLQGPLQSTRWFIFYFLYPFLRVNSTSVHDHELLSCPIRQVIMIALLWVCWQEINLLALLGCLMLDCSRLTLVCYPCPEIYLWEPNCYYAKISVGQSDRSRTGWVKAKTGVILIAILILPNWSVKIHLRPQVHSYFYIGGAYFDDTRRWAIVTDYCGLNCPPKNSYVEILTPIPQKVTMFEYRVFKEVIVLKWGY